MTEKEKMLAGEIYSAVDPQLIEELTEVKEIIHDYNLLRPSEKEKARKILKDLLGHIADDEILIIQPFYCDYGRLTKCQTLRDEKHLPSSRRGCSKVSRRKSQKHLLPADKTC